MADTKTRDPDDLAADKRTLEAERATIDQQIQDAALRGDLEEHRRLRQRAEELPVLLHGLTLATLNRQFDKAERELRELGKERTEARSEWDAAEEAFREASARFEEAKTRLGKVEHSRTMLRSEMVAARTDIGKYLRDIGSGEEGRVVMMGLKRRMGSV